MIITQIRNQEVNMITVYLQAMTINWMEMVNKCRLKKLMAGM